MVYPVFQPVVTAAGKRVKILRKRVLNQIQNNFDHLGLNPPQIYTFIIFLFGLFLPLFFAQWSLPPEYLPRSAGLRFWWEWDRSFSGMSQRLKFVDIILVTVWKSIFLLLFSCLASSSLCLLRGEVFPGNVCLVLSDRDSGGRGKFLECLFPEASFTLWWEIDCFIWYRFF